MGNFCIAAPQDFAGEDDQALLGGSQGLGMGRALGGLIQAMLCGPGVPSTQHLMQDVTKFTLLLTTHMVRVRFV